MSSLKDGAMKKHDQTNTYLGANSEIPTTRDVVDISIKNVWEVAHLLKVRYGDFNHHNRKNPLNELLFIICSTQTDEKKYLDTYRRLRDAFPRIEQFIDASESEIADAIKSGGLYNQKAAAIKGVVTELSYQFGRPTLAPLKLMSDEQCESFLLSLPGVGKKTARCIMLYSLGRQVFPVDTHCWRISIRLGWISPSCSNGRCYPKDMDLLQEKIPASLRHSLHVNFVSLGREICKDRNPDCLACPIFHLCPKIDVLHASALPSTD